MPRTKNSGPEADRPKGPANAYVFFLKICRDEHKRRFPDETVDPMEFTKKCAERWKTMTIKEKTKFNQMEELDKKRFQTEIGIYAQSGNGVRKKRTRKAKDPRAPKRSMSAFFWFAQDERPQVRAANPNFAVGDIAKELGRRWADATPKFKSNYEAKAEKDRERYMNAKVEFQQQLKDEKNGLIDDQFKLVEKPPIEDSEEEEPEEDAEDEREESE